jgi:hypothetical protein
MVNKLPDKSLTSDQWTGEERSAPILCPLSDFWVNRHFATALRAGNLYKLFKHLKNTRKSVINDILN